MNRVPYSHSSRRVRQISPRSSTETDARPGGHAAPRRDCGAQTEAVHCRSRLPAQCTELPNHRMRRADFTAFKQGCLTLNTRRFEDLFYRFSLRPSLFICERFSRHSLAILPPFRRNSSAFQIHFVALSRDFYRKFSALHGSLRQACLILAGSGVVGSPRLLGELFPAFTTLQQ